MDNQNWSRAIYKRTIFRLVIWAIRKYFPYGLENIWGTDKKTKTIVAYKWIGRLILKEQ